MTYLKFHHLEPLLLCPTLRISTSATKNTNNRYYASFVLKLMYVTKLNRIAEKTLRKPMTLQFKYLSPQPNMLLSKESILIYVHMIR